MATYPIRLMLLLSVSCILLVSLHPTSARILTKCEAYKQLLSTVTEKTFVRPYLCIMMHESRLNTSLKTGPGSMSSFSYGVFQINSKDWCTLSGGGHCKKRCADFIDDDIRDDIKCAEIIKEKGGLKTWKSYLKKCKKLEQLPNVTDCRTMLNSTELEIMDEIEDDEDLLLTTEVNQQEEHLNQMERREGIFMDFLRRKSLFSSNHSHEREPPANF